MTTKRLTYVYRPIVTRWPDWCPDGWDRAYSDEDRSGPSLSDGDPTQSPPDELRRLADGGLLPGDLPHHRVVVPVYPDDEAETEDWAIILCPKRDRVNWLSSAAAYRWVRHARSLGADAHLERGTVANWSKVGEPS